MRVAVAVERVVQIRVRVEMEEDIESPVELRMRAHQRPHDRMIAADGEPSCSTWQAPASIATKTPTGSAAGTVISPTSCVRPGLDRSRPLSVDVLDESLASAARRARGLSAAPRRNEDCSLMALPRS